MSAARQVIKEMKKERSEYEVGLQSELNFTFPITVPFRKVGTDGTHDLGNIMHSKLPKNIALVWFVLGLIAVSAELGSPYGFPIAAVLYIAGGLIYKFCVSRKIDAVVRSIKYDYKNTIRKNRRAVRLGEGKAIITKRTIT